MTIFAALRSVSPGFPAPAALVECAGVERKGLPAWGMGMRVTDSHIHFFETERYRYSWLDEEGMAGITRPFAAEDYLRLATEGQVEVEAAIHVHAEPDEDTDQAELIRHLQALHTEVGVPAAAVGWADLSSSAFSETLEELSEVPIFRGIRQHVFFPPGDERYPTQAPRPNMMGERRWRAGFRELGERGLTYDLLFWWNQLPEAVQLLNDVPETTVVIEHSLFPSIWPSFETWRQAVQSLPVRENTYAKVSAFGQMGTVTTEKVRPYVEVLLDHFGSGNVLVASNYPVDRLHSSWAELWEAYIGSLAALSEEERDQVLRSNARRAYGLPQEPK